MPVSAMLKSKLITLTSQYNTRLASPRLLFFNNNLFINAVFQISNMRNDADKAIPVCQARKSLHRLIQGFFVKRAKSFVNKHGIKLNTTGRCLDLIRESQCKRERRLEGFTTRKCLYTSFCAVVMVNNVKIKPALTAVIFRFSSAL